MDRDANFSATGPTRHTMDISRQGGTGVQVDLTPENASEQFLVQLMEDGVGQITSQAGVSRRQPSWTPGPKSIPSPLFDLLDGQLGGSGLLKFEVLWGSNMRVLQLMDILE